MLGPLLAGCAATPHISGSGASDGGALNAQADRLILVTVANPGTALMSEPGSTPHGYERTGAYVVGDQARATAAALAHDYGLQLVRQWPIAPLKVHCLVFALPLQAERAAVLRGLAQDRRVRLAQPLQLFGALGAEATSVATTRAAAGAPSYNDPYFALQRGFTEIGAGAAQQWSRGEGVRVAIIDTGADVHHPDLAGRIAATANFVDQDMRAFDADRHGTEVAGIIGAVANNGLGIVGVAPAARLQIYKACQAQQPQSIGAWCNSFTLALALSAAIDAHAQVVNLSLGGPADPLLTQLVDFGERRGTVFVGAVPEDGRLDGFPLGIDGVIAVDVSDARRHSPAVLYAPGRDILSLAPDGHYDFGSGSSFAAAHVTGAIALLLARMPHLDAARLFALLERTRANIGSDDTIDVCAALAAAYPPDHCLRAASAVVNSATAH